MNAVAIFSLPLAALPERPALGESIVYQLNGLVVVFTALALIWGLLEVMAFFFKRQVPAPAAVTPVIAPSAPAAVAGGGLEPEVVAAMAAAVHATLGGGRITSIVQVDAPIQGWGLEGRRQIHSARKVR